MTKRRLALPVADAAGPAGPDLNPRIERLGIERIAVAVGEFRAHRAARLPGLQAWFLDAHRRLLDGQIGNARALHVEPGLGGRLRAYLRALAVAIAARLHRKRLEFGRRTEPIRRQHCPGKVEAEELVGTILVSDRHPAPSQKQGAGDGDEQILQDYSKPPEIRKLQQEPDVGNKRAQFQTMSRARLLSAGAADCNFHDFVPEEGTIAAP